MGRIGKSYPRPLASSGQAPIVKGRVLFLKPKEALRYHLLRAEPIIWLFVVVALIGGAIALGL
jgi:hypothetical protein